MKKLFAMLAMFALGCSGGGAKYSLKESTDVISHINASTAAIMMKDTSGESETTYRVICTAVWVSKDVLLTAHHCVRAISEDNEDWDKKHEVFYSVQSEVGEVASEPSAVHSSTLLADDKDHDISLLKVDVSDMPSHEVSAIASHNPVVGEHLRFVGHVRGLYWTYVEGVVAGYRNKLLGEEGPYLQVSAPVYKGNSGGGAFTESGELVGIASFLVQAPNCAFYIPIEHINRLIKSVK